MPHGLRDVLLADPTGDPWASFTSAMAFAEAGFPVSPCRTTGERAKGPYGGWGAASSDYETTRDRFLQRPGAAVGLATGGSLAVIDIDPRRGGSLERAEAHSVTLDGYREQTGGGGWHILLSMPDGLAAPRGVEPCPGVEIKGDGQGVVSPHSIVNGNRYAPEPGRDVWYVPLMSAALLRAWQEKLKERHSLETYDPTGDDETDARRIIQELLAGPKRDRVRDILDRRRHIVGERSTADFALAVLAAHGLRGHPRRPDIVAALISTYSVKARSHPNPDHYVGITATAALHSDHKHYGTEADRVGRVRDRIHRGLHGGHNPYSQPPTPKGVLMLHGQPKVT